MPNILITGEGPLNARIIAIGECPAHYEEIHGGPFKGPSGYKWNPWLTAVGLTRKEIRVDNVCQYRAPGDNIENFDADYLVDWMRHLHDRIACLRDPYVLVPMGNYATYALTGKGKVRAAVRKAFGEEIKVSKAEKKAGITKLRGSIYTYVDLNGRSMKVIPTVHPAFLLHGMNAKWEKRCVADWKRIEEESKTHELNLPNYQHQIIQSTEELDTLMPEIEQNQFIMAVDIETPTNVLTCIGFCYKLNHSLVIPTTPKENLIKYLPYIKRICESPSQKLTQFGLYDAYWLDSFDIKLVNWLWDIGLMHHVLDPIEDHALHYLCSRYTKQPYYKDMAKDADEIIKYVHGLEALLTYNGIDNTVTREVFDVLYPMLVERGMLDFYIKHYAEMLPVLLDVMRHGVRVDTQKQKKWSKRLLTECAGIRQELKEAAGEDLFAQKDFSRDKLIKFFYETLGLPKQTKWTKGKRGKRRTVTLDETALRKLTVNFSQKIGKWGLKVLKHREKKKESDYLRGAWDKDGRIRCSYKLTTEAGRLASAKNPMGKGYNLQNVKR